jgi:hypothetical protein
MFSFYKHATLILNSLERVAYIDPGAGSNGWQPTACLMCKEYFEYLCRDRQGTSVPLYPSVTARSVRQLPTLKTATSSVAFRDVLNQEVFRMHSKVPFDRFTCRYVAKFRYTNSFPTHSHVTSPPVTACRMRLGCSSILGADMTIRLLSTNATICMYLESVGIGSSLDSWTRRTNIGVQSVTRYCLGLRLDLSRGVCGKNETSSTPIG